MMTPRLHVLVLVLGFALLGIDSVRAQPTSSPDPIPTEEEEDFVTDTTDVGYIDPAIPRTTVRLRYDAAFDNIFPNRGEFFYAGPTRGIPVREPSVDYQDFRTYIEVAPDPRYSAFFEIPVRFVNPTITENDAGLGDINAGFKYAFLQDECRTATFQVRGYGPSGRRRTGLGNAHWTVEPGVLFYREWTNRFRTEAEVRSWVPIGGTEFAGTVLRYSVGASYTLFCYRGVKVSPVAEFVNWTFLGGKKTQLLPGGLTRPVSAADDHILNAKIGTRVRFGDSFDIYAGYGRPLTGETLYSNVFRLELRYRY